MEPMRGGDSRGTADGPRLESPCHDAPARPSFGEALRFWLKLGFISFGGPTGQIAIMHTELVEKRRWIGEGRFLHALNFCMLLPGPEAQQLAIYCGWLLHRTWGGIVAGALFVLPSAGILWLCCGYWTRRPSNLEAFCKGLERSTQRFIMNLKP